MKENALHNILKSILSLSLNAQGRANQSTNVMYKRGQDLVPARLEGKKLPKVGYFSPILQLVVVSLTRPQRTSISTCTTVISAKYSEGNFIPIKKKRQLPCLKLVWVADHSEEITLMGLQVDQHWLGSTF